MSVENIVAAGAEPALPAAEPQPAPAVAVKALEWNPFRAETPFGYYHIDDQTDRSPEELNGRLPFLLSGSRVDLSRHPTLADALASAQSDYDARIRSALSAQVQDAEEQRTETCERCQGNGEIVTDWERFRHPHENDVGDEAVAECPDCDGIGEVSAQVQDVAGWQSIETAPKDGTQFLAFDKGSYFNCWWHDNGYGEQYWMDDADSEPNPSHWMPLPAAPAKQEG